MAAAASEFLRSILPSNYPIKEVEVKGDLKEDLSAIFRVQCKSQLEFENWLSAFQESSGSQWIVRSTVPESRFEFRRFYVCHHNSHNKTSNGSRVRCKNTECSAKLDILIKKVTVYTKKKDLLLRAGFPAIIRLCWNHNHQVISADALSYRAISKEVKNIFWSYFSLDMDVRAAKKYYKSKLREKPNFTETMLADASIFPKDAQLHYLHQEWRKVNHGGRDETEMAEVLDNKILGYKSQGYLIGYSKDPFAIAVVTHLMQRVHGTLSSSEICFVDSSSSCDDLGYNVTFMLAATTIGALPLAFVVTRGLSAHSYIAGFTLVKDLLGDKAFFGKGHPSLFMTDKSAAEKLALEKVWPESKQLLCQFHVAQAVWRWIWKKGHVKEDNAADRKPLMKLFRNMMYASTLPELIEHFQAATESEIAMRNTKFIRYVKTKWWDIQEEWTLLHRLDDHCVRGHNTNNFSESAVRIFKEVVLSRIKAYNPVALIDFACNGLELHFAERLRNFAYCRNQKQHYILRRLMEKTDFITSADEIADKGNGIYWVPSSLRDDGSYDVDANLGICACVEGATGKFCKHQAAVTRFFNIGMPNAPMVTAADRRFAALLAMGDSAPPVDFFLGLRDQVSLPTEGMESNENEGGNKITEQEKSIEIGGENEMINQVTPIEIGDENEMIEQGKSKEIEREKEARKDEEFDTEWNKIAVKFNSICDKRRIDGKRDPNMLEAFDIFVKRAEAATTPSAFATLLASSKSVAPLRMRSGRKIPCQVTSKSRRKRKRRENGEETETEEEDEEHDTNMS